MISVIMSCYKSNRQYLKEAVLSILNQTYKDFELLVANNGVDFDLKRFLKDFGDSRIKYTDYGGKNIGAPLSYNVLADLAQGEYVAIQDHDDISLPCRLEIEKDALDRNKDLMSVSSTIKVFGGKREYFDGVAMKPEQVKEELLFWQPIKQPTFMQRKEFCKYKYDTSYFIYDYEFWSRTREMPHEILDNCLLLYRKSPLNSSKERAQKVRKEHALITQRNFAQLGIILPIETCEMLDPYNHKKYPAIFADKLMKQYRAITEHISIKTYTFMIYLMAKKITP